MRHALLIRLTARLLMGWGLWVLVFQPMNNPKITSYKLMIETGGNVVWGSFFALVGLAGVLLSKRAIPGWRVFWSGIVTSSGWCGIAAFFLVSVLQQDEFSLKLLNTGIYIYTLMFTSTLISAFRYYADAIKIPNEAHNE